MGLCLGLFLFVFNLLFSLPSLILFGLILFGLPLPRLGLPCLRAVFPLPRLPVLLPTSLASPPRRPRVCMLTVVA